MTLYVGKLIIDAVIAEAASARWMDVQRLDREPRLYANC
jgi:hypothetical protein